MKKTIKIFLISIFTFIIFSFGNYVQANSIDSINMDIFVDNNGNAFITERWTCNVTQGTEVYHPYYNLGNSEITDLNVILDSQTYTSKNSWNTSGSFSEKAYKCGINKISNGVELCWGISNYGKNTYITTYKISNFVAELTDAQMIYWTLIPYDFSNEIGSVYIKIHTNFDIEDTIDVWGYGNYGGTAYVYDGYIEMQSDGNLETDEYMTILVKFPLGSFSTENKLNNNFDYYYNMSQEGAVKYTSSTSIIETIEFIIGFVAMASVLIFFIQIAKLGMIQKTKLPNTKDIPYYRDIPVEGDIFKCYYISHIYNISRNKTDLLGAIILKWLKNSIISIEQKEVGAIFKKEDTVIILKETNPNLITNNKEKELFRMLYQASKDGYLESKEFEDWCSYSYEKIISWFDEIVLDEKQHAINQRLIVENTTKLFHFIPMTVKSATPELTEDALKIAGLKRYLNEYTLIKDRQAIEVHLFEDYLIFAQIMGIAKKVAKEFKDLYPEVIEQSTFTSYDNIIFIHTCASRGVNKAQSAKSRAESYDSGGGGFSSGGGGGGSFGGGGGGGGFR